jgi:hypothetical protein
MDNYETWVNCIYGLGIGGLGTKRELVHAAKDLSAP